MSDLMFPKPEKKKKEKKPSKRKRSKESSDLLLPKPQYQKKKRHKKSILQDEADKRCYLCMLLNDDYSIKRNLETHHVLFGNTHAFAEAEGLKVNLCLEHHRIGPAAVHNNNENAKLLMAIAQERWERNHSHEEWMERAECNYL